MFGKRIKSAFSKIKSAFNSAKNTYALTRKFKLAYDSAAMEIGRLAVGIIVALVVIVIAVELVPTVITSVSTASSNTTLTSNPHYTSAFSLLYLIPLIFVAGVIVVVLAMMFERKE